jgi:hypothetical protein
MVGETKPEVKAMDEMAKRILSGEPGLAAKRAPYGKAPPTTADVESEVLARLVREGFISAVRAHAAMQAHHGYPHAGGIPTGVSVPGVLTPHGIKIKRGSEPQPGIVREHKRKRALRYESIIKRLEEAMGYNDNGDLAMMLGDARLLACEMLAEVREEIKAEDERFKP